MTKTYHEKKRLLDDIHLIVNTKHWLIDQKRYEDAELIWQVFHDLEPYGQPPKRRIDLNKNRAMDLIVEYMEDKDLHDNT